MNLAGSCIEPEGAHTTLINYQESAMSSLGKSRKSRMTNQLHRAGGVFVVLFLMAGQSGQEVVQASFLLLAAACLAGAEFGSERETSLLLTK
ncbi:MAG: hypothetical protein ACSHXK_11020 [Oceanococcus sp.]